MHLPLQDFGNPSDGLTQTFAYGLPFQKEPSFSGNTAQVGKSEKVKTFGFALSPFLSTFGSIPTEFNQPGFLRVESETESREPFPHGCEVSFCF